MEHDDSIFRTLIIKVKYTERNRESGSAWDKKCVGEDMV